VRSGGLGLLPTGGAGGKGYLLVRRDGALWGVENEAVESLTRGDGNGGGGGFLLGLGAAELCADEIVGVVAELAVWPLTGALCRFWPEAAGSLSVHADEPLVVVDPRRPPRALRGPRGGDGREGHDGDDREGAGRDA
jgi:hypothetical protein